MRPELIEFREDMPVRAHIRNVLEYPYHWHQALEILYVLQGQATVGIDSETHLLRAGDIAVINTDQPHWIKSSSDNKLLMIHVDFPFCEKANPDYTYAFLYCCSLYHGEEAQGRYNRLKGYVVHLVYLLNQEPCPASQVVSCLQEMLSHMIASFDYLRYGPGNRAFKEKQVQRFKKMYQLIRQAPAQKCGLSELSQAVGITVPHLSHDIKERFGLTFQELLYGGKCTQAVRLLLSTDKFIYTISSECGFSDPKYLIKYFKLNYRCTPSEFRIRYKADEAALAAQTRYAEVSLTEAGAYLEFEKSGGMSG